MRVVSVKARFFVVGDNGDLRSAMERLSGEASVREREDGVPNNFCGTMNSDCSVLRRTKNSFMIYTCSRYYTSF